MAEDSSEVVREAQEAVSAVDVQVKGNGPAFLQNLSYANAVAHQQSMNQIGLAAVGKVIQLIVETSPTEGGVDVAALQQLMKGAQTTPPVTG